MLIPLSHKPRYIFLILFLYYFEYSFSFAKIVFSYFIYYILLVTLAGKEYNIAFFCRRDGNFYRLFAVYFRYVVFASYSHADIADYFSGVFCSRIVGGDYRKVGEACRDIAHLGTLCFISVAAAAEKRDYPAVIYLAQSRNGFSECVGCVRIIDYNIKIACIYAFHPAAHGREISERIRELLFGNAEKIRAGERRRRIVNIEVAERQYAFFYIM